MKQIKFTITGNQSDEKGNPVPKIKATGKMHFLPRSQAYTLWKSHVVNSFLRNDEYRYGEYVKNIYDFNKPIVLLPGECAFMVLGIQWKNEAHCDPENAFGSIADSLFYNDKHLNGLFFDGNTPNGHGQVDVLIYIFKSAVEKLSFLQDVINKTWIK